MKKEESDFAMLKRGNVCGEPHLQPSTQEGKARGFLTIFIGNEKGKSSAAFTIWQRALLMRPKTMGVVMTGRNARLELINLTDIAMEMRQLKQLHSATARLLPQAGMAY